MSWKRSLASALGVLMFLTGCSTSESNEEDRSTGADNRVVIGASWAEGYENISEMADSADLVVLGAVRAIEDRVLIDNHEDDTQDQIPLTWFIFGVEEVVAGGAIETDEVLVAQTGGDHAGRYFEVAGDPMMVEGERSMLFLRSSDERENGYSVLGGPTGRVLLNDGVEVLPESIISEPLPQTEEALTAKVQDQ